MRKIQRFLVFILASSIFLSASASPALTRQTPPRRTPAAPAAASASPRRGATAEANAPQRPRLVLLIAVDQFRYDYLERFGDLFGAGGLRRLMRDGAVWTNANYDHVPTETAPGHATMMTGAWPSETGIVGNEWFDRDAGKRVTSVVDEAAQLFGGGQKETAASPRRLLASTVGDELRVATNGRAKVVGISLKDRAAILPAGRHANAAYWFSPQTGRMVSSNYYFAQLPEWVVRFNDEGRPGKFCGARWERLLPEAEYLRRAGPDAPAWESLPGTNGESSFPHIIAGSASAPNPDCYNSLDASPFANDLILDFAQQAIVNEGLGADADTDVLTVSFSANDYVGHRFGPYSQEVMDITLRVDQQIAKLLDFVDARVGLANTLVAFTADHGVAPVPEHAASMGLPGTRIKQDDVLTAVKNAIRARYNKGGDKDTTSDYVLTFLPKTGNIYFNPVALARDGISREEIERVAGDAALTVPGVARYFTRTQFLSGSISPSDAVARRALHGFEPRRSGDVVIINKAYNLIVTYTADHYSPYSYDTHVPVIIMGARVAPGRYMQEAAPSDIAPTLASLLRIERPSNAMGRVLAEAIK